MAPVHGVYCTERSRTTQTSKMSGVLLIAAETVRKFQARSKGGAGRIQTRIHVGADGNGTAGLERKYTDEIRRVGIAREYGSSPIQHAAHRDASGYPLAGSEACAHLIPQGDARKFADECITQISE